MYLIWRLLESQPLATACTTNLNQLVHLIIQGALQTGGILVLLHGEYFGKDGVYVVHFFLEAFQWKVSNSFLFWASSFPLAVEVKLIAE